MTLGSPLSKCRRTATPDHPRFLGLAQLRSLLAHDEVVGNVLRSDAVLDLIGLLLRDAPALAVVRAFCRVRRLCGSVCYLAIFRLRRWLEEQIVVKSGRSSWQPVTLAFQDLGRIEQHYRRQAWELSPGAGDWRAVPVVFAWAYAEAGQVRPEAATA